MEGWGGEESAMRGGRSGEVWLGEGRGGVGKGGEMMGVVVGGSEGT